MCNTMIVFKVIQRNLTFMGYNRNERPFNRKQIEIAMIMILHTIMKIIYLIHTADTQRERFDAYFHILSIIVILTSFASTAYNMEIIFMCIDKLQCSVNESELNIQCITDLKKK